MKISPETSNEMLLKAQAQYELEKEKTDIPIFLMIRNGAILDAINDEVRRRGLLK